MKKAGTKIAGYILWGLIILLVLSLFRNINRSRQINSQIQAERDKLAKIKADNDKLSAQIALTQSPEFIEKEMRDKLGLAKEGEAIVVLPDPEILKKLAPEIPVETDTLPDPNWKKWLKLFF